MKINEEWDKYWDGKKIAFISPYSCPWGHHVEKEYVNGCTGWGGMFNQGVDFYYWGDVKDLTDLSVFNQYDYVSINIYPEFFNFVLRLRESYNGRIVGYTDINTRHIQHWELKDCENLCKALRAYDFVFCTNIDEVDMFIGCRGNNKGIGYTGWSSYGEITHIQERIHPQNKDINLIALGISNPGGFNRNVLENLTVAKNLLTYNQLKGLKFFTYYVTPNKKEGLESLRKLWGMEDHWDLVDELDYYTAIKYLSKAFIAIHIYDFAVVGRMSIDCGWLGIPFVSTNSQAPNRGLFPYTTVRDYDTTHATQKVIELLSNPTFYYQCAETAMRQAPFYSTPNTKLRMLVLLTGGTQYDIERLTYNNGCRYSDFRYAIGKNYSVV